MNRMNASRFASVAFGMTLVVLLGGITPFTNLYAQVRPKMQIAFVSNRDGNSEIYIIDGHGKNLRNLTNNPDTDRDPVWSPDGREIVFSSFRHGENGHGKSAIYVMRADGKNVRRLTNNPDGAGQPAWSPDGRRIAFQSDRNRLVGLDDDIYVMDANGKNIRNLTEHPGRDRHPTWSPDGRQIAFAAV